MRYLIFAAVVIFGLAIGAVVSAYPGEFDSPPAPQLLQVSGAFAHYDIQAHSRDTNTWADDATESMSAEHGSNCSAPPATHENHSYSGVVFVCSGHLMTAINAQGYGMVAVTPSQLLNCSASCTVQWDMSTERLSSRDWPDVWLTPWADNLTLPFDAGDVDLQGPPRQGLHLDAAANQNGWNCFSIANYVESDLGCPYYVAMDYGVSAGTNTAAARQTFKLTLTTGHLKFERLASGTAPQITFIDSACSCLMASDYVVQFAHHSYNPTKDGAGSPGTWHWANFTLSPSTPFTLIHSTPRAVMANNSLVTFNAPAPANAYLRFSGVCRVLIDDALAPRQTFIGHPEHASDYFIPIAQGKQSVSVSFAPDDANPAFTYSGPCVAQDFHIWSKGGTPPSPTPLPPTPSPTSTPIPPATVTATPVPPSPTPMPTSTAVPSTPTPLPTFTPVPTATSSPVPSPTATAVPPTATSTSVPPTPSATPLNVLCYRSLDGGSTIVLRPGVVSC